jgi:NADH-quinone oxidoreductase subunit J
VVETWQQLVLFGVGAAMSISALFVVLAQNVVHAAMWLVGALLGAAIMYLLLLADFVAWVQVLVYVGAIVVLLLFGLMLTRAPIGRANFDNAQRPVAAVTAAIVFGVLSWILVDAFEGTKIDLIRDEGTKTRSVGETIFSDYVLPFEVVSVLLLAALVGAVVISRRDVGEE